jgi:manganese oxidase
MRQFEFLADEEGDWAFHCHKSHHTMNAMGHNVPTMIGVDHRAVVKQITNLIPDYMVMGERGMADMGEMTMEIPDNTAPMMTGEGPFGGVEMGGMFSVLKVRKDQKRGDYSTVAREVTGAVAEPMRPEPTHMNAHGDSSMPMQHKAQPEVEVQIRKPSADAHKNH